MCVWLSAPKLTLQISEQRLSLVNKLCVVMRPKVLGASKCGAEPRSGAVASRNRNRFSSLIGDKLWFSPQALGPLCPLPSTPRCSKWSHPWGLARKLPPVNMCFLFKYKSIHTHACLYQFQSIIEEFAWCLLLILYLNFVLVLTFQPCFAKRRDSKIWWGNSVWNKEICLQGHQKPAASLSGWKGSHGGQDWKDFPCSCQTGRPGVTSLFLLTVIGRKVSPPPTVSNE